jgi:Ca2+-binding EF-hand superfamily protein
MVDDVKENAEKVVDSVKENVKEQTSATVSWICRTKFFKEWCDDAYDNIDMDDSGSIDEKELYSGLLMIHLKMGLYAGAAACKPISRERCTRIFHQMDKDNSGSLDKREFREVMMVLFSNVALRIAVQMTATIMLVPFLANRLVDAMLAVVSTIVHYYQYLEKQSSLVGAVESTADLTAASIISITPVYIRLFFGKLGDVIAWERLPLSLTSTLLSMMIIPALIFRVDEFIQWVVDVRAQDTKKQKKKKV